jgi:hypothetical protein
MRVVGLGMLVAVMACSGGGDSADAVQEQSGPGGEATGPTGGGSIAGTISFTGTAPANPTIDMAAEAKCAAEYQGQPRDPQYVVNDGKLGNVFVYVKSGLPAGATYRAPADTVVLDQKGCLYHPRVLGLMTGQTLRITNSDPLLHNIAATPTANRTFNISQPVAGLKAHQRFSTPEVMVPLACDVHGWMNAYAGVTSHPFFAVSGENGSYEIRNLPAGTYEIEAWHEKLGKKTMSVTVPDGGRGTGDFSFAPAAN